MPAEKDLVIIDAGVPQTREDESRVPLGLLSLQMARARATLIKECRVLAVGQTEPGDWYDYGGNPGMDVGAAERIRLLFGLQAYDLSVQREDKVDNKGDFYIYTVTGRIGNEREQRQFVRALPELLNGVNVSVVAWALLHDVGLEAFDANLNSVGLVTAGGRPKPAFAEFEKLHASTRR